MTPIQSCRRFETSIRRCNAFHIVLFIDILYLPHLPSLFLLLWHRCPIRTRPLIPGIETPRNTVKLEVQRLDLQLRVIFALHVEKVEASDGVLRATDTREDPTPKDAVAGDEDFEGVEALDRWRVDDALGPGFL